MNLNEAALAVVIIWIVIIIGFFVFLLRKYTFGKEWTAENPNPHVNETLAMPRGIMRAVLTLSVLFIVLLLEVNSLFFDPKDLLVGGKVFIPEQRFEQILVAFQMIIAFYFGSKVMHHLTAVQKKKYTVDAEARKVEAANHNIMDDETALG